MTEKSKMIWMYILIYIILIPIHFLVFLYFFFAIAQQINRLNADIRNVWIYVSIAMNIYIEVLTYLAYRYNLRYMYKEKNKKIFKVLSVVNLICTPFIVYISIFKI